MLGGTGTLGSVISRARRFNLCMIYQPSTRGCCRQAFKVIELMDLYYFFCSVAGAQLFQSGSESAVG